ncbi:MAG: hydantoinase/oxoprolinase family protein [Acidobacteriota bacterium]
MLRIGVDTGGTFTDFVVLEDGNVSVFKLPSTPKHPEKAVLQGLLRIVENREGYLIQHGSTVATNTLIERKGARTLLVANEGFEDILEIGRQNRPGLYKLSSSRPKALVPAKYRLGIKERTVWDGKSLIPLEKKSLDWLQNKVKQLAPEAIAVVLLYSYLNPEAEERIAEALEFAQLPLSLSHQVLPEFREYERTSATVINAYLTPTMSNYLSALSSDPLAQKGKLTIMQSNGGTIPAEAARSQPLRTLLSGPAGGVVGASELAQQAGYGSIITFDMGGTSTDVCLCDNRISTTKEATIDHQPIPVQMIAIHTVGSGGGSIARIDSGGLLRVGPQSAGADPGPVCYGKGRDVTVTDANLLLGRMESDYFLGGELKLYPHRVHPALEELAVKLRPFTRRSWKPAEIAEGIVKIVNTQMEAALQLISLQRGYDTRDFTLVSFGGAGGLHACELARALLIPRIVVPANPGMLSAMGILRADAVKDASLTVMMHSQDRDLSHRLKEAFRRLDKPIQQQLAKEGFSNKDLILERTLDARYVGQSYELNVAFDDNFLETFHRLHQQFYGYCNPQLPVEIVNIRVRGSAKYPTVPIPKFPLESKKPPRGAMIQEKQVTFNGRLIPSRFYLREHLRPGNRIQGPATILEYSSTTLIPADFKAHIDAWRNIVIEPDSADS